MELCDQQVDCIEKEQGDSSPHEGIDGKTDSNVNRRRRRRRKRRRQRLKRYMQMLNLGAPTASLSIALARTLFLLHEKVLKLCQNLLQLSIIRGMKHDHEGQPTREPTTSSAAENDKNDSINAKEAASWGLMGLCSWWSTFGTGKMWRTARGRRGTEGYGKISLRRAVDRKISNLIHLFSVALFAF